MWNFSSETPSQAKHAGFQVSVPLEASSGFVGGVAHEICLQTWAAFQRRPAEALPAAMDAAREIWANQGWVQVSFGRKLSFLQMKGQKSKWWDRLLMDIEMKVCINLAPPLIVITELSHLPIFRDMCYLSNEEGCWCNASEHTWGWPRRV